jgi:hypothetical protein
MTRTQEGLKHDSYGYSCHKLSCMTRTQEGLKPDSGTSDLLAYRGKPRTQEGLKHFGDLTERAAH